MIIPADRSGSRQIELLVTDPREGFHLLFIEDQNIMDKDGGNYIEQTARHYTDISEFSQDEGNN